MKLVSLNRVSGGDGTKLFPGKGYTGFPITSGGLLFFVCYTERKKWERFDLKNFRPEIEEKSDPWYDTPQGGYEKPKEPAIDPSALGEEIIALTRAKDENSDWPKAGVPCFKCHKINYVSLSTLDEGGKQECAKCGYLLRGP